MTALRKNIQQCRQVKLNLLTVKSASKLAPKTEQGDKTETGLCRSKTPRPGEQSSARYRKRAAQKVVNALKRASNTSRTKPKSSISVATIANQKLIQPTVHDEKTGSTKHVKSKLKSRRPLNRKGKKWRNMKRKRLEDDWDSGTQKSPSMGITGNLLQDFGMTKFKIEKPSIVPFPSLGHKRVKIDMIQAPQVLRAQARSTSKAKAPKRKLQTITDKATAQFRSANGTTTTTSADAIVSMESSNLPGTPSEESRKDARKMTYSRQTSKPSRVKVHPVLTPERAISNAQRQEHMFGTSSQLVAEDSPTSLRDLQYAIRQSEAAQRRYEAGSKLQLRGRLGPGRSRRLWTAAAQYHTEVESAKDDLPTDFKSAKTYYPGMIIADSEESGDEAADLVPATVSLQHENRNSIDGSISLDSMHTSLSGLQMFVRSPLASFQTDGTLATQSTVPSTLSAQSVSLTKLVAPAPIVQRLQSRSPKGFCETPSRRKHELLTRPHSSVQLSPFRRRVQNCTPELSLDDQSTLELILAVDDSDDFDDFDLEQPVPNRILSSSMVGTSP